MSDKQYTLEELKQKIDKYYNLNSRNNSRGRLLLNDIMEQIQLMYWNDVKKDGRQI